MDVEVIVLGPEVQEVDLRVTVHSIELFTYNRPKFAVVDAYTAPSDYAKLKKYCSVFKAGTTITSLINTGVKRAQRDWLYFVFAGGRIPNGIEKKWATFCKDDKDILYPLAAPYYNFVQGPFSGVLVNRRFFQSIGEMANIEASADDFNDFEFIKTVWLNDAIALGATLKGIAGIRVV